MNVFKMYYFSALRNAITFTKIYKYIIYKYFNTRVFDIFFRSSVTPQNILFDLSFYFSYLSFYIKLISYPAVSYLCYRDDLNISKQYSYYGFNKLCNSRFIDLSRTSNKLNCAF